MSSYECIVNLDARGMNIYDISISRLKTDAGTKVTAVETRLAFFSAKEKTFFNNWLFV
jgi:hypothetical protein